MCRCGCYSHVHSHLLWWLHGFLCFLRQCSCSRCRTLMSGRQLTWEKGLPKMMKRFWSSAALGLLMGSNSYAQPEMLFWWAFSERSCKHAAECGCGLLFPAVFCLLKWDSMNVERGKKDSPTASAVFFMLLILVRADLQIDYDLSFAGPCVRCLMWKHQTCCRRSKRAAWARCSTATLVRPITYWLLLSQTTLWRYSFPFL